MRRRRPRPAARRDRGLWVPGGTAAVPAHPEHCETNHEEHAVSIVASPSRSVAFTGRRAGESRVPSPGARRYQLQRTIKPAAAEPKETGSKGRDRNLRADRKCVFENGYVLWGGGEQRNSVYGFASQAKPEHPRPGISTEEKAESFLDCGVCLKDPPRRVPGWPLAILRMLRTWGRCFGLVTYFFPKPSCVDPVSLGFLFELRVPATFASVAPAAMSSSK